ncbi:hypothetical protein [Phaeodactylibacter sp.]|jgi:hypothetical protein|uniref:hypothetical protein n=1 Tax=Phaeodactylibacter sp. TaxID=1940289 RepID=UPI0025D1D3B7|nr:hypothetical protein [Phaeodactylibacter sp.]MCI4650377.1 hypothetical protein [Phaeodactylibacter sp.]MCI5094520.1 hypothetical protein [Phaeodactylibacter sp.]
MKEALFWIFIIIFSLTAIITLLGITGVIKTIKENYLNALFTALILEVVAAVVLLFQNTDFLTGPVADGPCLEEVITRSGLTAQAGQAANASDFLVEQLKRLSVLDAATGDQALLAAQLQERDSLLEVANTEIEALETELQQLGQQFYTKITKLRNYISQYGGFINLAWRAEDKAPVYRLLIEIFGDMGLIQDENTLYTGENRAQINFAAVRSIYKEYKASLQQAVDSDTKVYVGEYDTILFIRTYLNQTAY